MNKLSQTLLLSSALLLAKTEAFAMMEEQQSFRGSHTHVQSYNHGNSHARLQDKGQAFREAFIDFNSQNKPLKVAVPHKLVQKDLTTLDMSDITTPQCVPYAFKSKIFPLLRENELDKATLFTLAFVWNNPSEFDEFYAQLRELNQDIINVIRNGKESSQLFSEAEKETRNALEHLVPTKVAFEEAEVTYDNPFAIDDLSESLSSDRKGEALGNNLSVFEEEW